MILTRVVRTRSRGNIRRLVQVKFTVNQVQVRSKNSESRRIATSSLLYVRPTAALTKNQLNALPSPIAERCQQSVATNHISGRVTSLDVHAFDSLSQTAIRRKDLAEASVQLIENLCHLYTTFSGRE